MPEVNFPNLPPRRLAENIWEVPGTWKNKFGRRMTVVRLSDGDLIVHNAMKMSDSELAWLSSLGRVAHIVAPNVYHASDAPWMATRYPAAQIYVPQTKIAAFAKKGVAAKDVNADFPELPELRCIPMHGTRVQEAAFFHVPSRTLILCDLAFNMGDVYTGLERMLMNWNKVGVRFGPTRLTRLLFTKDKKALMNSYRELLALNFDRVVVNHGDVLESGGVAALRESVREIFGAV